MVFYIKKNLSVIPEMPASYVKQKRTFPLPELFH